VRGEHIVGGELGGHGACGGWREAFGFIESGEFGEFLFRCFGKFPLFLGE